MSEGLPRNGDGEIRIGVFVCDCGSNIAGVVDVPAVTEYARTLPHVAFADEGRWSCSVDYLGRLQSSIRDQALNRVVIASCTPRTHEPLFKASVREAGLNPYLLEFVSIREQVSWVHMKTPEVATRKAMDLVRMGVAKAALLEEGEEIRLPVQTDCLIIGGGIAGISAALAVAEQGFHAVLVERQGRLGGLLNRIDTVSEGERAMPAAEVVARAAERAAGHPKIDVHTATEVASVEGYIGNYKVGLRRAGAPADSAPTETIEISTVIVATGMRELEPVGHYRYGEDPRVVTQLQLEELLRAGDADAQLARHRDVVIINCVESKNDKRGCCRLGCFVSVRNALAIKARAPEARVSVLYRDLSLLRDEHVELAAARRAGVRFLRFADDRYPSMDEGGPDEETAGRLTVRVHDMLLDSELELPADLVVLTTAFVGDETVERVKGQLKVSASADGFFQEAHVKLGPLDFPSDGVALCGCAKAPKTLRESTEEGIGAAMRASIPMRRGYIEAEGIVADIDLTDCTQCGLCGTMCPYGAIRLDEEKRPEAIKALCKGCGLCVADCPTGSISLVHYRDDQLAAQIDAALAERPEEKILGFVCHWCALGGVDMAGVSRLQYPSHGRLIRVMCSARVPIKLVERAFERGAGGVLVAGCEFPTCHYITGNYACDKRMKRARRRLARKGYDADRLWNIWCSAADGPKFANAMREMVAKLGLPGR